MSGGLALLLVLAASSLLLGRPAGEPTPLEGGRAVLLLLAGAALLLGV